MGEMRSNFDNVNGDKLKIVAKIKLDYVEGRLSLEEARALLKEKVGSLKPYEIAVIEQETKEYDQDVCKKEDIQSMMDLFSEIMEDSKLSELPENHPIKCYYRENDAIREVLKQVEDLVQYPVIKNQWYEIYDKLAQYRLHLSRKQMQLYSILEKKGFNRPSEVMWTLDDYIRDEITDTRKLLDEGKEDEFIAFQPTLIEDILDLMSKEENILYPTSLTMISPKEFEDMKSGDREIGFCLIDVDGAKKEKTAEEKAPESQGDFAKDLALLLSKHGYQADTNKVFDVAMGKLTLDQINLVYKHLPIDLAYVDENEIVKFYSDTKHRVFPRSKNVIGRDVKNCHPKSSVHVVEEIINKFRSGEESFTEFWINKPEKFIYICYVAVRDDAGNFKGVLEMMQDCTHIRSLQDSRTLLTWESENEYKKEESEKEELKKDLEKNLEKENNMEITKETKLAKLIEAYPWLKEELPKINEKFHLINTPLAKVMLPIATIELMAERGEMTVDKLIEAIKAKNTPRIKS